MLDVAAEHLSINNLAPRHGSQARNHYQTAKLFLDKYKVSDLRRATGDSPR
jgi:hypothetical protein